MQFKMNRVICICFTIYLIITRNLILASGSRDKSTCSSVRYKKAVCLGKTLDIKCKNDTWILINYGNFGREDGFTCLQWTRTEDFTCDSSNETTEILNRECSAQQSCNKTVFIDVFSPLKCLGIAKYMYLIVVYQCLPPSCFLDDMATVSLQTTIAVDVYSITTPQQKTTNKKNSTYTCTVEPVPLVAIIAVNAGVLCTISVIVWAILYVVFRRKRGITTASSTNQRFPTTTYSDLAADRVQHVYGGRANQRSNTNEDNYYMTVSV